MSDDRFTQTTLRAPGVDQDQAIETYQSGTTQTMLIPRSIRGLKQSMPCARLQRV